MADALDFVAAVASLSGVPYSRDARAARLDLELDVQTFDGARVNYLLEIKQSNDARTLTVKEKEPSKLPSFCPQRHINPDGTFCLGFKSEFSSSIESEESAKSWIEILYRYLQLQYRAANNRRWTGDEWKHGEAAIHQSKAQKISVQIFGDLKFSDFSYQLTYSNKRTIIEVLVKGEIIYRVWKEYRRVINGKRKCVCGGPYKKKRRRFGRCYNHSKLAVELAFELENIDIAEEEFWREIKQRSYTCCNTCDYCPLKK